MRHLYQGGYHRLKLVVDPHTPIDISISNLRVNTLRCSTRPNPNYYLLTFP